MIFLEFIPLYLRRGLYTPQVAFKVAEVLTFQRIIAFQNTVNDKKKTDLKNIKEIFVPNKKVT